MSHLHFLDMIPSLVISFANIFSHSVGYLFILSMVSFAVQKLLLKVLFLIFLILTFLTPKAFCIGV